MQILKDLVLILSVIFVSVSAITPPIKLIPGQSYIYSYSGRLISGMLQMDSNAALMEIKSDIVLQAEKQGSHIAMQMMNIRVGKHNGPVTQSLFDSIVVDHQSQPEYEEQLSKPIRFYWDNGQIKNFEADRSEAEWSINVKKAILSLLNVNLAPKKLVANQKLKLNEILTSKNEYGWKETPQLVAYPVYEDGINGVCETYYQVIAVGNEERSWPLSSVQIFNVTKTRNYENCLTQPSIENTNNDIRGAPVICHRDKSYPLVDGYYPMLNEDEYQLGNCKSHMAKENNSPLNLYHYVKYKISTSPSQHSTQIDSIYGQGKTVYETKGKQMVLISEQNVTLVDVIDTAQMGSIREIRNIMLHQELSYRLPQTETKLEIPYYHFYGQIDKQELTNLIQPLLDSLAFDIENTEAIEPAKNTMQKVVQLANSLAVLDLKQLEDIFERITKQDRSNRASRHEQIVRKLFLDLVSTAGTTDSALFVKQLFEQDRITTIEAKEVLEAIPQNLFMVNGKVVEAYLNIFLSEKVQHQRHLASSIGIALGKLIKQATMKWQRISDNMNKEQWIGEQAQIRPEMKGNILAMNRIRRVVPWHQHIDQQQLLDEDQLLQVMKVLQKALKTSSTFHQKVTLIETLAHTGTSEALAMLAPYVENKVSNEELPGYIVSNEQEIIQERNFIRQVTIYALTHMSPAYRPQVTALLLPIFQNKLEPHEIRIAAFTVLLICDPGRATLERIGSEMHQESNRQVRSFVVSALNTVANFSEPSTKKLANDARFALGFAPKDDLGLQYSKMVGKSFYDEKKQYGLNVMAEWVASNISQIPRSGYLAIRENNGFSHNFLLELGYNAKGLDSIIRHIESNGIIDALQLFSKFDKQRNTLKRTWTSSASSVLEKSLETLKEQLDLKLRVEDEPKVTIFLKSFERTSYYSFDRQFIQQLIDSVKDSIKDIVNELTEEGRDYQYVKLAMPKQLYKVVSSEIGFPIVITERHPIIVSLKLNQAKLDLVPNDNKLISLPQGANLIFQIEPLIYHTTYHFIFGLSPVTTEAIGTHVEKNTRISIPIDFKIGFWRPTQQLSWSIIPKVPQEIYHHQTEVKTFIAKAKIAGAPERQWLAGSNIVKNRDIPFNYEREYLKKELGIGLRLKVTTERDNSIEQPWYNSKTIEKFGLMAALIEFWNNDQMTPCAVHLMLENDEKKPTLGYEMSIRYKKVNIDIQNQLSYDDDNDGNVWFDNDRTNRKNPIEWQNEMWQKMANDDKSSLMMIKRTIRNMIAKWNNETPDINEENIISHNIELMTTRKSSNSGPSARYAIKFLLAHTYDQKTYWIDVQGSSLNLRDSSEVNSQVCFDSMIQFPNWPNDFYYEPKATRDLKALIKAKLDFGDNCHNGAHIELQGMMNNGQEKMIVLDKELYLNGLDSQQQKNINKPWFYQQCQMDRANSKPTSYACQRALNEDSHFKQLTLEINYENIPAKILKWSERFATATKTVLYWHLNEDYQVEHNDMINKQLRIKMQYSNEFSDLPLLDIFVNTPNENMFFQKVNPTSIGSISSLLNGVVSGRNWLIENQKEDQCTMMENYVRTFDNVTVQLDDSNCQYLLAKDCSSLERFAIIARKLDTKSNTKEATVLVDDNKIVLWPFNSDSKINAEINGQMVELKKNQVKIMSNGEMIIHVRETSNGDSMMEIRHNKYDFTVLYDGRNIQVQVGQRYRGETCGICGDNNHESDNEFIGPDSCIYLKAEDFINSYALADKHCEGMRKMKGPKICSKQETIVKKDNLPEYVPLSKLIGEWIFEKKSNQNQKITDPRHNIEGKNIGRWAEFGTQQQRPIQRLRTMTIRENERVCFSIQPIVSCIEGRSVPTQYQEQMLGFHCLPSQSISAQKLVEQAQFQVLEIFGKKQVDLIAPFQIPVSCRNV